MPALTIYFALAGFVPFSILLVATASGTWQRLRRPGSFGLTGAAVSLVLIVALSAIDAGFAALVLRSAALALHPPG